MHVLTCLDDMLHARHLAHMGGTLLLGCSPCNFGIGIQMDGVDVSQTREMLLPPVAMPKADRRYDERVFAELQVRMNGHLHV